MPAKTSQVIDSQEFIPVVDYEFAGNTVTVENKRRFIEAFRDKGTVYHAAQAAGISRKTAYRYLQDDPAFAQAMADCQEDVVDKLETSAYERALGVNGHKPDTLLTMFYLKAKRPQFRDKVAVDIPAIQSQVKEYIQGLIQQAQLQPAIVGGSNGNGDYVNATHIDQQPGQKDQLLLSPAPATHDDPA